MNTCLSAADLEDGTISSTEEMYRAGAAFLITDLRLALEMLDSANHLNTKAWARSYTNATNAYNTVLEFRSGLDLTLSESETLDALLMRLKGRLDAQRPED